MDTAAEQRLLRISIVFITLISGVGIAAGSCAILFNGVYSTVDVAMTMIGLSVSPLITQERSPRFQFGHWHLEPMVAALNAASPCSPAFTLSPMH